MFSSRSWSLEITPFRVITVLVSIGVVYVVGPLLLINSISGCFIVPELTLSSAERVAGLASGIGTLFLVLLTGWYSMETRRMVQVQKNQRTNVWYDDTLSVVRRMAETWRHLVTTESEADGSVDLTQYPDEWEHLESLAEQLDEQMSRRPAQINPEITDATRSFLRQWRLFSRSQPYRIGTESDLFGHLTDVESKLESETERS